MDAYLLDTTILTVFLDSSHPKHAEISQALNALPSAAPQYVSVVALAELRFGADLAAVLGKGDLQQLKKKIQVASTYAELDITHHTATAYAELKASLAVKYLANPLRRKRPPYLENWIDQATSKALGVGENDLWMCAQAKERDLVFVTTDKKMQRIADVDSEVCLLVL